MTLLRSMIMSRLNALQLPLTDAECGHWPIA
jgi:hypothetical protein